MLSFRSRLFLLASGAVGRRFEGRPIPSPHALRASVARGLGVLPVPKDVNVQERRVGRVDVEVLRPRLPRTDRVMLYVHGGGYVTGSPRTHRPFTARLASALACEVWVPDYRLAPEHPFPHGLDDCHAVWTAFASEHAECALLLGGESAGGGLSLALTYRLREAGARLPDKLYLQSAWLDLRLAGASYRDLDAGDIMSSTRLTEEGFARHYAGESPRDDVRMSPVLDDPAGLPPTYVQVGSREIFLSDSEEFVRRARAANVDVELEVGRGLWHAWPLLAPLIPEATASIERVRRWVDRPRESR